MTQADLNTHIIHTQNLYADLVNDKYLAKLKLGKVCDEAELSMVVVRKYLKYLYKYQPFAGTVTYAYKFEIVRLTDTTVDINITIGAESITYSGTGTLNDILTFFKTSFNNSGVYAFVAEVIDGILYIYSFDVALTFLTATTVSTTDILRATIAQTNIQNTYCTILDLKNCLTTTQLCDIINSGYSLLTECSCN